LRRRDHPRRIRNNPRALAVSVPLLLLPQGADQYSNAERIVTASAGLQLLRDDLSVDAVRDSVHAVLDNARYRRSAERIQTEIHEMPDARDAVRRIEALTRG
jgi:UDP:flavonoid glycosyltransferase YjiC (YdhE family)